MATSEISKEQWAKFEKVYRTRWRQLHRWRALGIANTDPCPLEDPRAMPLWWVRNNTHAVPTKILQAARDNGATTTDLPPSQQKNTSPPQHLAAPLDISSFDLDEGQEVTFQRSLIASLQHRIIEEAKLGHSTDFLQQQHAKAARTLRDMERDDRLDRAQRDKSIPREIYELHAVQAADMLRQMHNFIPRRVIELSPGLSAKQRRTVHAAIERVLASQARIFQDLGAKFTSQDQILTTLAAA